MDVPDFLQFRASEIITMESDRADKRRLWAVILGLKPKLDGDKWSIVWGENIQTGVVAFGDTPSDAIWSFEKAMYAACKAKCAVEEAEPKQQTECDDE